MPILAVEGPDCCGKTTLVDALACDIRFAGAKFVRRMPKVSPELFANMQIVQDREAALWEALYDPNTLYVCDRFFAVSAAVYDELYSREPRDYSLWRLEVSVLYVAVPMETLKRRLAERGDQHFDAANFEELVKLYDKHVASFRHVPVAGDVESAVRAARAMGVLT